MKIILLALIFGLVFLPATAAAQRWVDSQTEKDGTEVEEHWQTPEDSWKKKFTQPGTVNPLTGQFNTYGRRTNQGVSRVNRGLENLNTSPGPSSGSSNALPGSSAPNPYAVPGSSPVPMAPKK